MWETFEHVLEVGNAAIAVVVLYLGIRAAPRLTLAFQRRAVLSFLGAIVLFASSEVFAIFRMSNLFAGAEVLRELAETGFVVCLLFALYFLRESERHEVTALRRWADTDALTGLHDQGYFRRAAKRRFEQAREHNRPLSLILLDIDNFKAYNDSFGHEAGNAAINCVADILRESVRADDVLARYGGEEFAVLISDELGHAAATAERIRANLESRCTPALNPQLCRQLTASFGVAPLGDSPRSLEAFVEAADKRLYQAKHAGKNCVKVEGAVGIQSQNIVAAGSIS